MALGVSGILAPLVLSGLVQVAPRAEAPMPGILPLRERAALRDRWLAERLDIVVPALMRREGIDMWVLIAREYNEDPVVSTMLPASWFSARRRTVLVFHAPGNDEPVERFAVSRYPVGDFFPSVWDRESQPNQWKRIAELIHERQPRRIALNLSVDFALADGLSATQHEVFLAFLDEETRSRVVSGENLAIGWLETRIPAELEVYPTICRIAHGVIAEGFSERAIQAGHTTTADVEWWYRERILELGLTTWFHPSVSIQRGGEASSGFFAEPDAADVIRRGDLLHVDLGITYLGLNTDTQQHAYVLRNGEAEAPPGLRKAMKVGNRLQDLLMKNFRTGSTGNEILRQTIEAAQAEGIAPTIYTHPLGYHGHGAGPMIGLWDQQGGVPGRGDYPLWPDTVHSIELNAAVEVPEWGDLEIRVMLEEDALFDGEKTSFLDGRQTSLLLIP